MLFDSDGKTATWGEMELLDGLAVELELPDDIILSIAIGIDAIGDITKLCGITGL